MRILPCHKCGGLVYEYLMGRQCPYCKEWLYTHLSEEVMQEESEGEKKT